MVVAYDLNRAIGASGDLPWKRSLPADLHNFKRLTMRKTVIMGRKTYESMGSKPLAGRENIVLSSRPLSGVMVAKNIKEAIEKSSNDICIIGGGRVFSEGMVLADTIYATEVQHEFPGVDVYFPELDSKWQEVSRQHFAADEKNKYDFDIIKYQKVKPKSAP